MGSKEMVPTNHSVPGESSLGPCLFGIHPKNSKSSYITQVLFKLLLLCWVLNSVIWRANLLRAETQVSYSPLALLELSPAAFQRKPYQGLSSQCRSPAMGIPDMGLDPLSLLFL